MAIVSGGGPPQGALVAHATALLARQRRPSTWQTPGVNFARFDHYGWALPRAQSRAEAIAACHAAPQKSRASREKTQHCWVSALH